MITEVKDLTGGLSLRESQLLDNNQFKTLRNFFYNKDKRLQTRLGISQYFNLIPDTVVLLDALNATTGWTGTDDAVSVTTGTAIRGTFSLQFGITVATSGTNQATLTKTTLSADISLAKGYLGFWLFVPTGFNTNLTAVKLRLGSDSSNYYEWTLSTLTENKSQFIKLNFSDAVTTGSPVDTTIAYSRLQVTYSASYTDKAGIRIDDLQAYSSTSTKPPTSYFHTYDYASAKRVTLVSCGTNMFSWNESGWDRIDSSLSEFETVDGRTTERTRWGYFAWNGSGTLEVGMCNGVNDYRTWNGVLMSTHAAQPKCRYFIVSNERIVSAGADTAPLTVYYTNAAPANAQTLNTNDLDVGNEENGRINTLFEIGELTMVGKDEKVFYIDYDNQICKPIDSQNGAFSNRVTSNVGNAVLYLGKSGIDNLAQKTYSTGANALVSEGYTSDLEALTNLIQPKQINANCGQNVKDLNNFYFSFDTDGDNVPDTTLVYSSLIGKTWSQYTYPAAYQYGYYIDTNFNYNYLLCSATSGIIYKIENGFDDDGALIEYEFETKDFDLKTPSNWKDFEYIDLYGLKNEGGECEIELIVEGEVVYTATLDDTYIDTSSNVVTIASDPVATQSTGGGASTTSTTESIDTYPYKIRLAGELFASGKTISIRGYSDSNPLVMTLDRIVIKHELGTDDLFEYANFA